MKFKDVNFPSIAEIRRAARERVARAQGKWPEDDWFDIGEHWSVNLWLDGRRRRITVYADHFDRGGHRATEILGGIQLSP